MSKIKLSPAQEEFLREAASEAMDGKGGRASYSESATAKALLRRGLVENTHQTIWSVCVRWRPTAAGYAWLGLEPPHE